MKLTDKNIVCFYLKYYFYNKVYIRKTLSQHYYNCKSFHFVNII